MKVLMPSSGRLNSTIPTPLALDRLSSADTLEGLEAFPAPREREEDPRLVLAFASLSVDGMLSRFKKWSGKWRVENVSERYAPLVLSGMGFIGLKP